MNITSRAILVAFLAASLAAGGFAQTAKKVVKKTPGESSLIGVRLYTSGVSLINRFGSPNQILPIGINGSGAGSGGGAPRPSGGAGAAPSGGGPRGSGEAPQGRGIVDWAMPGVIGDPFGMGQSEDLLQNAPRKGNPSAAGPGGGGPPPGVGGGAPGAAGGAAGASADGVTYTRWVYRRGSAEYGFIIDKYMRVVQIEAIGMNDPKVSTSRGVKFGASFADVIRKYGTPDGYDIDGDMITIRYLVREKVAFRLQRMAANKPHVVTGIVVAAGKA